MASLPILYHSSTTATTDVPFKVTRSPMWFESLDIFVRDESAYLGDIGDQDVLVHAGDIYFLLHPVNLDDYFFRNVTAGSNTKIVVAGILLSDTRKKQLGIPVD